MFQIREAVIFDEFFENCTMITQIKTKKTRVSSSKLIEISKIENENLTKPQDRFECLTVRQMFDLLS